MNTVSVSPDLQLIMYDLDGTLVDSAPDLAHAINGLLKEMHYQAVTLQQVCQWVGNGSSLLVKRALANAENIPLRNLPENLYQQGHHLFFKYYRKHNGQSAKLYPNVEKTLRYFHNSGIRQSIVTNKPKEFTEPLLNALGINSFFSSLISGDSFTEKKPHPLPLLECLKLNKTIANNSLMVGDSISDIEAAKKANVDCICVNYGYHQGMDLSQYCKKIINDLSQLTVRES